MGHSVEEIAAGLAPMGACMCKELRAVFADRGNVPRCGWCVLQVEKRALEAAGYKLIPLGHRRAYEDCTVETKGLRDHTSWAPAWAVDIVAILYDERSAYCGPILARAASDEAFRDAVDTVMRLAPPWDVPRNAATSFSEYATRTAAKQALRQRLEALAVAEGVQPLPVVTR